MLDPVKGCNHPGGCPGEPTTTVRGMAWCDDHVPAGELRAMMNEDGGRLAAGGFLVIGRFR
jgi:hypothetical protein